MNVSKVWRPGCSKFVPKFRNAHSAASASSQPAFESLHKQEPKSTKNINGISVATIENYDPISQISILIKAGSRYETSDNFGITHCLRNAAVLSSKNQTSFSLVRNIEINGGKLQLASTRDYLIYTLQCVRDHVEQAFPILAEIVSQQSFKPWEVKDSNPRMKADLAMLKLNPEALLLEALHKVAFKGGLSNSLYSPKFMIGKHSPEMLHEYVKENFVAGRTVVAGLGVEHAHLEKLVTRDLNINSGERATPASKFSGGEIRIDSGIPFTRAAIIAEGAGLNNTKECLSLGVLQCVLGTGPLTKHSFGESTKLGEAAAKSTNKPFSVSSVNLNYNDTGAFGVYIAGDPKDMRELVKSVVSQMRNVTKNLSDSDIQNGKHALKAKLLLDLQSSKDVVENMAIQIGTSGNLMFAAELEKAIDSLSASDINGIASKVMKSKPAMGAIGQLQDTPYLDELL